MRLPPALANAYRTLIQRHNLGDLAHSRDPENLPSGGVTAELAHLHFAQAFDGSVARTQLALLDPNGDVIRASNALVASFAGNSTSLTDAPCGAGAAAFAFLACIAELRAQDVLPRLPLDVRLIGAEVSESARILAAEMLLELSPILQEQAITVTANFIPWDVIDDVSNTRLVNQMTLMSASCSKRLLVVANFTGFLQREGRRADAEPQLRALFRHAAEEAKRSVAIWIEPKMNISTGQGGLFAAVSRWAAERWRRFAQVNTEGQAADPVLTSECLFESPVRGDLPHRVRLAVMRLDLVTS
jgi:hypothetical protein